MAKKRHNICRNCGKTARQARTFKYCYGDEYSGRSDTHTWLYDDEQVVEGNLPKSDSYQDSVALPSASMSSHPHIALLPNKDVLDDLLKDIDNMGQAIPKSDPFFTIKEGHIGYSRLKFKGKTIAILGGIIQEHVGRRIYLRGDTLSLEGRE